MAKLSKALFIGRFQPFHLGHLAIVQRIIKEQGGVIIAIGSSQESNTWENPFSAEERKKMIEACLQSEGIKEYSICFVPDLGRHDHWVEHVARITGKIDVIYTGSALTKELFSKAGYSIVDLPRIEEISATMVREKLAKGERIDKYVHKDVIALLKQINAHGRLKALYNRT